MTQKNTEPNLFELSNDDVQISYSSSSIVGKPKFSYQNGQNEPLNFTGDEITVERASAESWLV